MVYFHFKFHQNRTRFSAFFKILFIHSLKILMCVHWISDHRTSTFKKSIIPKLFRAGHRFFQWCLMIPKSNSSKNFSTLGEFSKDLQAKEVTVRFFFCHSYTFIVSLIDEYNKVFILGKIINLTLCLHFQSQTCYWNCKKDIIALV